MVYFHIPFVSIDEGVASSDLEDSLSQFNENFKSLDEVISRGHVYELRTLKNPLFFNKD